MRLKLGDGSVLEADLLVGADGIDSLVRRTLWGDAPKREHNLHIIGGFTFDDTLDVPTGRCVVSHTRTIQGSWTSIRHEGRAGFQWWVLGAFDSSTEFTGDLHETATKMAEGFAFPLPQLVAATDPASLQRWPIRDRPPLEKWSKGRATLVGDAAHPTSPYAAYGAGMSIEDGYFLGRRIAGVDISDPVALSAALEAYEAPRKPHTAFQVDTAYKLGKIFHHIPAPVRPVRDLFFDHSAVPAEDDRRRHAWRDPQAARRDRSRRARLPGQARPADFERTVMITLLSHLSYVAITSPERAPA